MSVGQISCSYCFGAARRYEGVGGEAANLPCCFLWRSPRVGVRWHDDTRNMHSFLTGTNTQGGRRRYAFLSERGRLRGVIRLCFVCAGGFTAAFLRVFSWKTLLVQESFACQSDCLYMLFFRTRGAFSGNFRRLHSIKV